VILLSGEAGIGKSRLVQVLGVLAHGRIVRVIHPVHMRYRETIVVLDVRV
jgi:MoxR-like ATPase